MTACSASNADGDEGDDDGAALTDAPLSYVGKNVLQTLMNQQELKALQGRTWDVSRGNVLENGWLLPTFGSEWWGDKITTLPTDTTCADGEPRCDADFHMRTCDSNSDCPSGTCQAFEPSRRADGDTAKKMCVGYGDWFEEEMYRTIVSAQQQVDITSLWLPTDRFEPTIRNGLARLAARGKPITVRILSGDVTDLGPLASRKTSGALDGVTRGLPQNAPLKIYVAEHSAALLSWNHSKIVAADGKHAMVGGHNMHTADYQLKDPVSDLSMRLSGPAAIETHRYVNEIWKVACERGSLHGLGLNTYPSGMDCPPAYEPSVPAAGDGQTTVIAAGRLGAVKDNASDAALLAMVDAAKQSIVMSQEDLLGGRIPKTNLSAAPPPRPLLEHLTAAIGRGVHVYIVISNVDGGLFTTSYSHGWTAAETAQQITDIMKTKTDAFRPGTDIVGELCDKLHVAALRVSDQDRWPDGKVFSNHSKFLMIDQTAFYVGSQNLYSSDLAEFGYIVDDAAAAKTADETFWKPLWKYSQKTAVSGSGAACVFKK